MKLPQWAKQRTPALRKFGVIELFGKKHILSHKFYEFADKPGTYTRKRGLDKNTNKQLLLKHIREHKKTGSRLRDLADVLPALTRFQVQKLLAEPKNENLIQIVGKTSSAKWYPQTSGNGQQ